MKKGEGAGGSPPAPRELKALLGRAAAHWARLREGLDADHGSLAETWSYTAKTQRWSLRLTHEGKKRTVVYLIPQAGRFEAAFALGEKACRAARAGGLAPAVLEVIEQAPRYAEGRGVRLEVRTRRQAEDVRRLAVIKMAN